MRLDASAAQGALPINPIAYAEVSMGLRIISWYQKFSMQCVGLATAASLRKTEGPRRSVDSVRSGLGLDADEFRLTLGWGVTQIGV